MDFDRLSGCLWDFAYSASSNAPEQMGTKCLCCLYLKLVSSLTACYWLLHCRLCFCGLRWQHCSTYSVSPFICFFICINPAALIDKMRSLQIKSCGLPQGMKPLKWHLILATKWAVRASKPTSEYVSSGWINRQPICKFN